MGNNDNYTSLAELGSGMVNYINQYYEKARQGNIVNLQGRYWMEARFKMQELNENNFSPEEALLIINLLCHSLETLAGVNINPGNMRIDRRSGEPQTPSLWRLYHETLPREKQWNIFLDRNDLESDFNTMVRFQNNLCKHINRSESRQRMLDDFAQEVDYQKLQRYMEVTKEIWKWILNKRFNEEVPDKQKCFLE